MTRSTTTAEIAPVVVAVAPLPPPLHGAAATTEGILDFLRPRVRLALADISPGTAEGFARHVVRIGRTIKALGVLIKHAGGKGRVLYMTADGGPGMLYNIAVGGLGTLLGYRVFLHHHSFAYVDQRTVLMRTLAGILAARGTHIVLCQAMADGLRALYPIGRTFELSSAALLPAQARINRPSGPVLRMGFLSNLILEKGLDTSIDLLRAARGEGLLVELVIAGRAPDRRPLDLIDAAKAEFGDNLTYLGPLSEADKIAFLDGLDVFLFPSRYFNEAQPRAVLEALAVGVPVLTIARSCITGDMGEGTGLCAPRGANFVASALPVVRQWASDRTALEAVSDTALMRGRTLHAAGQGHLQNLADTFLAPT